jgi:putative transposase
VVKPADRKPIVVFLMERFGFSQRRACALAQVSRTGFRYKAAGYGDERLRKRLKELAAKYSRYGYLMLHALLKREGLVVSRKRTYRVYTEEGLQVRTKKRKKLTRPRIVSDPATEINQSWSMDFVSDQLANHRRFRILNVVDDYTREIVGQLTEYSISGARVARFLSDLIEVRGKPGSITCDNGTEFTSKAMFFWSQETQVKLNFIQPGKPTQNAFVESFNGRFRDACLNQHWFRILQEARYEVAKWQHHYNNERPHSSLNYLTPVAFAEKAA